MTQVYFGEGIQETVADRQQWSTAEEEKTDMVVTNGAGVPLAPDSKRK